MPTRRCLFALLVAAVGVNTAGAAKQDPAPALRITSPAPGTVVHPGDRVIVTVEAAAGANARVTGVVLIGEDTGFSEPQSGLPARIPITFSTKAAAGPSDVTAMGDPWPGTRVRSDPFTFDVEPAGDITSLEVQMSKVFFGAPGETSPILLTGYMAGGAYITLSESRRVRYVSSDPAVATVAATGIVTATAPGRASVMVSYTHAGRTVSTPVAVEVRVPPLAPSKYALDFGPQRVALTATQSVTVRNTLNYAVTVIGIEATPYFSQTNDCLARSPVPPGASCTITVRFTPREPGERIGELTIATRATSSPVTIPLKGTGIK